MKKWNPKKKIVMLSLGAALLSILLYFGSLILVLREIKKIENLNKDFNSSSSRGERFQIIKSISENNMAEIQTLRDFFIKKGDEVRFIEQIEETARKNGITFEINSIDVKPGQTTGFKEDVLVKMAISGSWKNTIGFIKNLEKMSFGVSIQNINLTNESIAEWSGLVEFVIFREK